MGTLDQIAEIAILLILLAVYNPSATRPTIGLGLQDFLLIGEFILVLGVFCVVPNQKYATQTNVVDLRQKLISIER